MTTLNLTNDELHAVLTMRNRASLVMGHCEDYPCCGHTEQDPCRREWYDHPDAFNPLVNPHCFCDHQSGFCEVDGYGEEVDPEDCEHGDWTLRRGRYECDLCGSDLVLVTDVSPRAYASRVVPGLMLEIPVLGTHFEVKW